MSHIFSTRIWRFIRKTFIIMFIAQLVYIILLRWMPVFTTPYIAWQWMHGKKIHKTWVGDDKISEKMREAVISSEDQAFDEHFGFDIQEIKKAMESNKKHPKKIKGASTISQQVAKNVFLWQNRNWLRKGLEVYFTLMIEIFWSKDRILEVYLNVAEMGDGVFGVEAAAKQYYNKHAATLTQSESALIAAVLPNPIKFKVKDPSAYVLKRQKWIINQMNNINWGE
jgi:monofunctional glycosyltransferase